MSKDENKDQSVLREIYCKIADIKCDISSFIIKDKNANDNFLRIVFEKLQKIQNEIKKATPIAARIPSSNEFNKFPTGITNVSTKKAIKSAIAKKMGRE